MAVTRPEKDFAEVAEALGKSGAVPVSVPAIVIDYSSNAELTNALARVGEFDWAVFTSKNAAEAVFRTTDTISGPRVAAVGPRTAAELEARRVKVDLIPDEHTAEGLLDAMGNVDGLRILLPQSAIARPTLRNGLTSKGAHVTAVTAYHTLSVKVDRSLLGAADVILFSSPSAVESVVNGGGVPEHAKIVCVGPTTTRTAAELGLEIHATARDHSAESLAQAILSKS